MKKDRIRVKYSSIQWGGSIEDTITELIRMKKEAKKEGWTDLEVNAFVITGMRLETDEEYKIRLNATEALERLSTKELMAMYRSRSKASHNLQRQIIKRVLDGRENLPSGKFENKAVRILKKKYRIKKTQDLYKDHSVEVSKLTKELEAK